jgi:dihydroorotase
MSLLIKNAIIVDTDKMSGQPQDILIEQGTIVEIVPSGYGRDRSRPVPTVVDAKGKLVLPGLIDLHAHLREPGREDKETIQTGSRAAAKGGFTTIMCMPNTSPVIDNAMIVEAILNEAKRVGMVNVIPVGAITRGQKGEELTDMWELKRAGCLALSDDGRAVSNGQLMRLGMEYAKMADILLIEHCQDPQLWAKGVMNEGKTSTILGLKGDPGVSETVIVARNIELAHYLNTKVHLAHISLKRSVELIRFAKSQGIRVTAEACPHHFTLTEEAVKTFDTNMKVSPPLRTREDVDAIKEALADGTIDCIATDHAPHTREDKESDFDHAPFGMIGLETAVGLTVTELVNPGLLSWPQVVERMSAGPARIVRLANKGRIKEGADADIVIIDPDKKWVVKKEEFVSKSKNSPFIGMELDGCVISTICSGNIVYNAESK